MKPGLTFLPALLSLLLAFAAPAAAQAAATPVCGAPPAILQSTQPDIFSEQQEQWLGDAEADMYEHVYRPVKDAAQNAYLQGIGARLLAALPPTKIQFHFMLVDSSEINAYSTAGGRVYVMRKLVANAQSEDEIAGVMAHELGHILTHQFVYETTAEWKRLLGVTAVGDRADIYTKFQQYVDARMRDKHPGLGETDEKQDQADRVAVYAMAAAGYQPQAYAEFWDRSFFVGGKTGSGLSDFFHATKPDQKRLRQLRKLVSDLRAGCGSSTHSVDLAFQKWRGEVIANQAAAPAAVAAASEIQLNPPLRLDMDHVRFSRDGKYILAQDESSIFVVSRDPFKTLFRIDAERAFKASFTPDSTAIVFDTPGLHFERWSIAEHKLIEAQEVVYSKACLQSVLAPDGRTLACISINSEGTSVDLALLDVDTSQAVFEKKNWFSPSYAFLYLLAMNDRFGTPQLLVPATLSGDGNMLVLGGGNTKLAFDLRTRTSIKLGGPFLNEIQSVYAFQGNDKLLGVNQSYPEGSGIFAFPDGQRLTKLKLNIAWASQVSGNNGLFIVPPPKDFAISVANLTTGKYVALSRTPVIDMFGDSVATEEGDGSLVLYNPSVQDPSNIHRAVLPLSPLVRGKAVALSPDGRYLSLSSKHRSGIWDLSTGNQINHARGYTAAQWTTDGRLLAEFPAFETSEHRIAEADLNGKTFTPFTTKLEDTQHLEADRLLAWKKDKKTFTLTASNPKDNAVQWTRAFVDDRPGYTIDQADGDLIFSMSLQSTPGKDKLRNDPTLKAQAAAVKNKDSARIVEIAEPATGKMRQQVVIEVPLTYAGADGYTSVADLLYLSAIDNRTIVYSLATGTQIRQTFGTVVSADPSSGRIVMLNRRDELQVLDRTGAELQHISLGSTIHFAALLGKGSELIVLTADQKIRRFHIAAAAQTAAVH